MSTRTTWRWLLVALAWPLFAACHGGGQTPATPTAVDDARDAVVAYARCLRGRGMDVADPQPGGGGGAVSAMEVPEPRTAADEQAIKACAHLLRAAGSQRERAGADDGYRESLLAHARCMRDHGVDYPDPTILPDGAIDISTPAGAGSPAFAEAQEACKHLGGVQILDGGAVVSGTGRRG